jgi:hypothetical protein
MVAGALASKYASRQATDTKRRPLNHMNISLCADFADYSACIIYRLIRQPDSSGFAPE